MPVDESLRNAIPTSGDGVPAEGLGALGGLGGAGIADRTEHLAGIDVDPHSFDSILQDARAGSTFGGTVDGRTHDLGIGGGTNDAPLLDIEGSTRSGQGVPDAVLIESNGAVTNEGREMGFTDAVLIESNGVVTEEGREMGFTDSSVMNEPEPVVVGEPEPSSTAPAEEEDYVIIIEDEDPPADGSSGTTVDATTGGSPTEDYAEGTSPTPRTPGSTPTDAIDRSIEIGLSNAAPGSGTTNPDPMGETYIAVDGPPTGDQPSVVDPGDDYYGDSTVDRDAAQDILDDGQMPDEEFFDD